MTVVVLSDCPPKLRGDLSKWLLEVNTGVYVGNISARVRERLWQRICDHLRHGRATMVFHTNNEQHMDFLVHNTTWNPVDFDGVKLMRHPTSTGKKENILSEELGLQKGFSNAAHRQMTHKAASKRKHVLNYTVIDIETTGLDPLKDDIIELGALRVREGQIASKFSVLVKTDKLLPQSISDLTGLTQTNLQAGSSLHRAMSEFIDFIGDDTLLCHNGAFDQKFLLMACKSLDFPVIYNRIVDTLPLARRKMQGVVDYKLSTVAQYFGLDITGMHRALNDCMLTHCIYMKLNENDASQDEKQGV